MSPDHGAGKNANYGWANVEAPLEDPAVNAWIARLWAKPCTWEEYEEMRRIAAERNRTKGAKQ